MGNVLSTARVFVIVVTVGLFAMAARGVTDPDVWWHLRTGELITLTHHVPHTDPFSFTKFGQPWIAHEWLSEVVMYNVYRSSGWGGLIIVFAAMSAATVMLAYARSRGRPYIAAAVTVWGAAASAPIWGVRPQTISLLLASAFFLLLERSEHRPGLIWWTIPLTIVWVNVHGGYALGIALLLLFAAGEVLDFLFGWKARSTAMLRVRNLSLATLACMAVVPLNPNGTRMYSYPVETLRSSAIQSYISEWFSPDFHQHKFLPFLLLLLGTLVAIAFTKTRARPRDLLLLAATLWGALHSVRHIPIFVLVAIPVLSSALHSIRQESKSGQRYAIRSSRMKLAFNAVLLAAFAVFTAVRVRTVILQQPQVEAEHFPAAAVTFILQHHPPPPLLNHYNWGGYLIWKLYPAYQVFIDGRSDLYGDAFMDQFRQLAYLQGTGINALNEWNIRTVLLPLDTPLVAALNLSHDWTETYRDQRAVIFMRK